MKLFRKVFVLPLTLMVLTLAMFSCDLLGGGGDSSSSDESDGAPMATQRKNPGSGKSSVSEGSNSKELFSGANPLPASALKAQHLYTIAVNYPNGDYTGETTASFSLKGSGSVKKVKSSLVFAPKSVPSGSSYWNDMWDLNSYTYETVTGRYWFTDENNKIKYYISDGSSAYYHYTDEKGNVCGVLPAYSGLGVYTSFSSSDYWSGLKSELQGGILKDVNMLKGEREAFDMKEYNKDGTDYFYVVFCDFGTGSASVYGSGSYGGTAGAYDPSHIRPGSYSNGADIFYVNARFVEAGMQAGAGYEGICEGIVETLLHEYMHYLMDSNRLLGAEEEYSEHINSITGTIYSETGSVRALGPFEADMMLKSSSLYGTLFWIEGTANYAPYRMVGVTDKSAVSTWLEAMDMWRPLINRSDSWKADTQEDMNFSYINYGAGGLFFSWLAEKYGEDAINAVCRWRDTANGSFKDCSTKDEVNANTGNINVICRSVMGKSFKELYLEFLLQCVSSLSDSVTFPGSVEDFDAPDDWGFSDGLAGAMHYYSDSDSSDRFVVASNSVTSGVSRSNLPELSFVISRWDGIPESLDLTVSQGNVKCYALWW